ncbi:PAS domain-containing protein [Chloroflexus aggregans]|uniref:PAS/PAC sensor protein n=1 Tax=Chloroflexus aggregans (strain MD-66 / DSM 9485) TaxID=326427 RepID=B8GBI8_CHLAD|nr:PAS domain-containing protein [Chloroflexus aggregans]ACL24816.1 putative PAS/PAC sensor protein [Chloroflexus aggregans DSM 9485]
MTADNQQILRELNDLRHRYAMLVRALRLMIYDYDVATGAIMWSGETEQVCGRAIQELDGGLAQWEELIHPDDRERALTLLSEAEANLREYDIEYRFQHKNGSYVWILDRGYFLAGPDGKAVRMVGMMQNISKIKAIEFERLQMQEEVIAAQERALRELSTPLVPISERAVALPLVGSIDQRRANLIIETLLEGVSNRGTEVVIIDITGVNTVDTFIADALIRAARAVRLLGAHVILTGISPEVAQTVVSLGADLSVFETRATLQDGIALVMNNQIAPAPRRNDNPINPPMRRRKE